MRAGHRARVGVAAHAAVVKDVMTVLGIAVLTTVAVLVFAAGASADGEDDTSFGTGGSAYGLIGGETELFPIGTPRTARDR